MRAVLVVLQDLYQFTRASLRAATPVTNQATVYHQQLTQTPSATVDRYLETIHATDHTPDREESSITSQLTTTQSVDVPGNTLYVARTEVVLYTSPTAVFDNALLLIPFGQSLQYVTREGRWVRVLYDEMCGWCLYDELTATKSAVEPAWRAGQYYDHESVETKIVRQVNAPNIHVPETELALQVEEYVFFWLHQTGRSLQWPPVRPRLAGSWHTILKGALGVHMSVFPKSSAIMEYYAGEEGRLAIVDAVHPDSTISISTIVDGVYLEQTLSRDEWIELRPVFIEVA